MPQLQVILLLALLIFVHELGHFMAARLQGIYANRFSIGFGPVLWKYQGKMTEYALRALPLGGFVGFPDDDPDSEIPPNDPNLLRNRPVMDRAIVISAGVIANFLFAYFVLVSQVGLVGIPALNYAPGVKIAPIMTDSPAAKAGLLDNDLVLRVNQTDLPAARESLELLKDEIGRNAGKPVTLEIQRGETKQTITVTPQSPTNQPENGSAAPAIGRIGVGLASNGTPYYQRPTSVSNAFGEAAKRFEMITVQTFKGFGQLITNFGQTANQVSGPVAIVSEGAKLAKADPTNLFTFAALISINLAVINILPLPALDGGQLFFLLIEAVFRRPVNKRIQENFMQTGLVLMLGLGVFLIIRDTANLFPK
jgi:membrane-associated protease RseP (regulator of RpoE activity)